MIGRNLIRRRLIPALAPGFLAIVAVLVLSLFIPGSWQHAAAEPAPMETQLQVTVAIIDRLRLYLAGGMLILLFWCFGLIFYVYPADNRRSDRSRWDRSGPKFRQRPLLNKGEGRLLTLLDRVVPDISGPGARVCPQVSYGEFLACSKFRKFARMNCRRADFVVISEDHRVALVVELQGSGHFGSSSKSAWAVRNADRTKRSALQEAGIPLLEVRRGASEATVAKQIHGLISPHQEGYSHV